MRNLSCFVPNCQYYSPLPQRIWKVCKLLLSTIWFCVDRYYQSFTSTTVGIGIDVYNRVILVYSYCYIDGLILLHQWTILLLNMHTPYFHNHCQSPQRPRPRTGRTRQGISHTVQDILWAWVDGNQTYSNNSLGLHSSRCSSLSRDDKLEAARIFDLASFSSPSWWQILKIWLTIP